MEEIDVEMAEAQPQDNLCDEDHEVIEGMSEIMADCLDQIKRRQPDIRETTKMAETMTKRMINLMEGRPNVA